MGGRRTQHDEPLRLLDTVLIGLGVAEGRDVNLVGLVNLLLGTVADEDGLAAPLDDDLCFLSISSAFSACISDCID
jgi:hypothetical protein